MSEIWKDILGFEDSYQVSNLGNVRSKSRTISSLNRWGSESTYTVVGKVLKLRVVMGYLAIKLNHDGKHTRYGHRMVAEAFIPNPLNLKEVNHKDGNKRNNAVQNLEWADRKSNIEHAYDNELAHSGSSSHYAKLIEKTVAEIIFINSSTQLSYPKIAELFNICPASVSNMCRGRSWKRPHVRIVIDYWIVLFQSGEAPLTVDLNSITLSKLNARKKRAA